LTRAARSDILRAVPPAELALSIGLESLAIPCLRALVAVPCLLAFLPAAAAAAADPPYPRLGLYGHVDGRGWPLIRTGGTLETALLDDVARHHTVVLDATPFTEYRPDVLAALRARRPDLTLLGYVQGQYAFRSSQADSTVNLPTRLRIVIRNLNGFLYAKNGTEFRNANINLAKRAQGRYVVAEAMADFFRDQVLVPGGWNGLFLDRFCNSILWDQSPTDSIDYVRAGYSSPAAFDAAWLAATDTLANRLRRRAGATPVFIGNCGQGTKYASFNGWMRENFPFQGPGTWEGNVFADPGGYVPDQARFRAPYAGWLTSWPAGSGAPEDPENVRRARKALATAALADGYGTINPPDIDPATGYLSWWFDEYAVDRTTGQTSTSIAHTGWLGRPKGPAYRMFWVQPGVEDACAQNPGFETSVTTGWSFLATNGAIVVRDAVGAPVGTASARITVPTPTGGYAAVRWRTLGEVFFIPDTYSATFWAKASAPRTIEVAAVRSTGETYVAAVESVGTTWARHQVRLQGTLGFARLELRTGGTSGTVWFDDVHFQRGSTGAYRRDFDGGAVLLNDDGQAWTITLEKPFRRIGGRLDTIVNDGVLSTLVDVAGGDAVFLIDPAGGVVGVGPPAAAASPLAWSHPAPNPSPGGAIVRLALAFAGPEATDASIDVYDAAGRRVRRLHRGALEPGEHAFAWDGRDDAGRTVGAGLYFARARAGRADAVTKLVRT
jgi:hypothetical protein